MFGHTFCFPNVHCIDATIVLRTYVHVGRMIGLINEKKVIDLIVILYYDRCEFRNEVSRCQGSKGGTTHTYKYVQRIRVRTGPERMKQYYYYIFIVSFFLSYDDDDYCYYYYTIGYRCRLLLTFTMLLCRVSTGTRSTVRCDLCTSPERIAARTLPLIPAMVIRFPLFVLRSSLPFGRVRFPGARDTRPTSAVVIDYANRLPIILGSRIVIFRFSTSRRPAFDATLFAAGHFST